MALTTPNMGLKEWDLLGDVYSHTDLVTNWNAVDSHDHTAGKGVQIPTGGITNLAVTGPKIAASAIDSSKIQDGTIANADLAASIISNDKLSTASLQQLGLTNGAQVGRGKSIIATPESRTNVAYGTLTTPDQVTGFVLPTDGLIVMAYQALWQESVAGAARAAIFVGATQLKAAPNSTNQSSAPVPQEASTGSGSVFNDDLALASQSGGLASEQAPSNVIYSGDVTTGQILGLSGAGGPCYIFAAAGTYTVSVQFKSTSGSVTVKNRRLWVWSVGF